MFSYLLQGVFLLAILFEPTEGNHRHVCRCGIDKHFNYDYYNYIIGGSITDRNQYPWMVRIVGGCAGGLCGGVLISNRHIATAFHCMNTVGAANRNQPCDHSNGERRAILGAHVFNVKTEETDGIVRSLTKHWYPPYNVLDGQNPLSHDFAIYEVDRPVLFTDRISPICLPKFEHEDFEGETAIAAGWGDYRRGKHPNSDVLRHVELKVSRTIPSLPKIFTTITAKNKFGEWADPCAGDSGGPLMKRNRFGRFVLIGTVQGGGFDCDRNKIWTFLQDSNQWWNKITAHLPFIRSVLGDQKCAWNY